MTSRRRKRLSSAQRRSKIFSASVGLFAARGYDGVSMDEIAAAAGVTKPVLYDHFQSKQALFEAVLAAIRDDLISRGQSVAATSEGAEQSFRAGVDAFFAFVEQEPDSMRVLLILPRGDAELVKVAQEVQVGVSAGISKSLATFLPPGEPWRIDATTELLKEGLHALAEWWLKNPGPSRADLVEVVMSSVWAGLGGSRRRSSARQAF
jgi:AcrR family transcriptional regulator